MVFTLYIPAPVFMSISIFSTCSFPVFTVTFTAEVALLISLSVSFEYDPRT